MKIADALILARQILTKNLVGNPNLDSLILLSRAASFTKEKIIFNPDLELEPKTEKLFFDFISRRSKREPVSHIISNREFFGKDFFVSADVLDPRPDSETLIESVLEIFPDKNQKLKILDIGSGSGCLSITLLLQYINSDATALDISKKALAICEKNSKTHKINDRLTLILSDLFDAVEPQKFDLIISNPPYIPSSQIESLQDEVRLFEPRIALDGGNDGLDFYRKIAASAKDFLKRNGYVAVEIGYDQKNEVLNIFSAEKFTLHSSKKDLAGIERALVFKN